MRRLLWICLILSAIAIAAWGWSQILMPAARAGNAIVQHHIRARPLAVLLHIGFGPLALTAGAGQCLPYVRRRWRKLHRYCGQVYVAACLLSAAGGLVLALHTAHGAIAGAGFLLLDLCWAATAIQLLRHGRARRVGQHRAWALRSYALTLAAVSLRIYMPAGVVLFNLDFDILYPSVAWLCWLPNLLLAEVFVIRQPQKSLTMPPTSQSP